MEALWMAVNSRKDTLVGRQPNRNEETWRQLGGEQEERPRRDLKKHGNFGPIPDQRRLANIGQTQLITTSINSESCPSPCSCLRLDKDSQPCVSFPIYSTHDCGVSPRCLPFSLPFSAFSHFVNGIRVWEQFLPNWAPIPSSM
jgi:hypothetical protein